jgi:hypothetical protein
MFARPGTLNQAVALELHGSMTVTSVPTPTVELTAIRPFAAVTIA